MHDLFLKSSNTVWAAMCVR